MVQSISTYLGDLRCSVEHGPSGTKIETDAPKDNQGLGESFSPTDLVASALGTCILTVMGIMARRLNVDLAGAHATVEKTMVADPARRIGEIQVEISLPAGISEQNRTKLERAALTCPVHKSLHPNTKIPIIFNWG